MGEFWQPWAKHASVTQQFKGTSEDPVQKFITFKSPYKHLNLFTKYGLLEILVGGLGFSNVDPRQM